MTITFKTAFDNFLKKTNNSIQSIFDNKILLFKTELLPTCDKHNSIKTLFKQRQTRSFTT